MTWWKYCWPILCFDPSIGCPMLATRRCNLPSTAALIPRGRTLPARTSNSTKQGRINEQHLTVNSLLQVSHLETAHTITLKDFSIGLVSISCSFIPDQMWFLMLCSFLNLAGQTNYFTAVPNDTTMDGYLTLNNKKTALSFLMITRRNAKKKNWLRAPNKVSYLWPSNEITILDVSNTATGEQRL